MTSAAEPARTGTKSGWSLRRRLALAVTALGVILAGLMVGAVILLLQLRSEQSNVIDRYFTAVGIANNRLAAQLDAETAVRGYALTADRASLQPLRTYRSAAYAAEGQKIISLTGNDPSVSTAFVRWTDASNTWYREWVQPSIAAVRANGLDALSPQEVLTGKALFDASRNAESQFARVLVAKRNRASSSLQVRTNLLFGAVAVIVVFVILATLLLWEALRRWVVEPLAEVGTQTRDVRGGNLLREVRVRGPREMTTLAGDVEDMRRALVTQLEEVERARQEIEQGRRRLIAQAEELTRSNRDLEQFAYVASHDLQEPLRKVASFCQMLERRYAEELDDRGRQYIAFAVDGAKRMQQLINDLLAFSRIGRMPDLADVDLNDCLQAALANLAGSIEASSAEVSSTVLPVVRGQTGLFTQLFQNLVGNALKFQGTEPPRVQINAHRVDDGWEFACSDNGLGIEPRYAERIFVLFQRLHGKDEYAGTGIGLALCKRIVEFHGGRIWLDTDGAAGGGATFRWTVPDINSDSGKPEESP